MLPLRIEQKDDTPEIIFDIENEIFEITGKSLPEDVIDFYQPVYNWLEEYVRDPLEKSVFKVKIEYFNSASHKAINDLLNILTKAKKNGGDIIINWYFLREDEDMLESGNDYEELTGLKFEYIGYI